MQRLPANWISDLLPVEPVDEVQEVYDSPVKSRSHWFWLLFTLLCAVATGLILPLESPFPYQYSVDTAWKYNTLKAPFDFEVTKPMDDVKHIIQEINSDQRPYYWQNPDILKQQKKELVRLIREQTKLSSQDAQYADLVANPNAYIVYGSRMLDLVFEKGIIELRNEADSIIYISSGNAEKTVRSDSLFSLNSARGLLTDSLPFSALRQPELLFPILDKLLIINTLYSDSLSLILKKRKLSEAIGTGVKVQKGELIVESGTRLTPETVLKLDSLAARYTLPDTIVVRFGFGMYAFLCFGLFFIWLRYFRRQFWREQQRVMLLAAIILLATGLFSLCHQGGDAVPLLLPFFIIPLALANFSGLSVGIATWVVVVVLTGFSLSWNGTWWSIHAGGLLVALFQNAQINSWFDRVRALVLILTVQIWIWGAAVLVDNLPDTLQHPEIIFMLTIAALLSLTQSVLIRFTGIKS